MPPKMSKRSKSSRFPVARIKKIMQMDEEVGKLASATPVMISKSLECFLQVLIDEASKETRERGSRKIGAGHLKSMIDKNPQFDFLRDLVQSVPDPVEHRSVATAGPSRRKAGGDGESTPNRTRKPSRADFAATGLTVEGGRRGRKPKLSGEQTGDDIKNEGVAPPGTLPSIGTWKREAEGGGGTGEDGKGMFDDYEDDNYDDW